MDKELQINWSKDGIRIHIEGNITMKDAVMVLKYIREKPMTRDTK